MNVQIRFKYPDNPIRYIKGRDLLPNPANWRTHPIAQLNALRGIFAEIGMVDVLKGVETVTGQTMLIDGHARAGILPDNDVPVLILDITDEEAKKILATFDPLGAMAEADAEALNKLLDEVQSENADINKLLQEMRDANPFPDDGQGPGGGGDEFDATPQEQGSTRSQPGDLWLIGGKHRLLVGDATQEPNIARLMEGAHANMLLTDPPYGVAYVGKTADALVIENDKLDEVQLLTFLAAAFSGAVKHLQPGGSFYIWHADSLGFTFRTACVDVGLRIRQCLVWAKSTVLGRQDYQWKHEPCLYGWKNGAAHTWLSDRSQTTVLEFDKPNRNAEHPTMKPLALFEYLIGN